MKLRPLHRARRFFASLVPGHLSADDVSWVTGLLGEGELRAFERMAMRDRVHSVAVTRRVAANLERVDLFEADPEARWILAAALLHDVGKSVADLGIYGRVVATLSGAVGGASMADHWAEQGGLTRRIGLYLKYPALGADILRLAGSDERVVAWSAQHHSDEEDWTIPVEVGRLLAAADDGRL